MNQDPELDKLSKKYQTYVDSFPERVPLNTKTRYKRKMVGYEEWKIEYTTESPDTTPEPAGSRIPAYLLVPTDYRYGAGVRRVGLNFQSILGGLGKAR